MKTLLNVVSQQRLMEYEHDATDGKKERPRSGYIENILQFSEQHYTSTQR